MDEKDLKQIEGLFNKGFARIWQDNLEPTLKVLEDGQEQIKLRLDNVAYRFELEALQKRVEFLEKKLGVQHENI